MIVLLGESCSGKSTIEKELVKKHGYKKIISYTTRSPRQGEIDGVDYHFITEEKFHELVLKGFFAENAKYNGGDYGSAKEDCTNEKVCVLTPSGLRQLKQDKNLHIVSFYIKASRCDRLIASLKRGKGSDEEIEESKRRDGSDVGQFDGVESEVTFTIENDFSKEISEITEEIIYLLD